MTQKNSHNTHLIGTFGALHGFGRLAQLGEHHVRNVGAGGSNPLPSTIHVRQPVFLPARDYHRYANKINT